MAENKLEQTKNNFKLTGIVSGIENEDAIFEGETNKDGRDFKVLSFFVETAPKSRHKVQLFGMKRDKVYAYSSKEKKSKAIPFEDRHKSHGSYKVMGTNVQVGKNEKGKIEKQIMVEWDAIDYIQENLKDGDSVFVAGDIGYNYNSEKDITYRQLEINVISKTKNEVDFEKEDFKEVAGFDQDIVVWDTEKDAEQNRLIIYGKHVDYKGEATDIDMFVDADKNKKLAQNMKKRLSTGDAIKVYGKIINRIEEVEVEEEEVEEDDWGGEMPEGMDSYGTQFVSELEVTAVDSSTYEKGKYNEEDLVVEDEENFGEDDDFDGDDFDEDGEDDFDEDDDAFDEDEEEEDF